MTGAVFRANQKPDPHLSGRPLSAWLNELKRPPSERHPDTGRALASGAEDAFPRLREILVARDHPWRRLLLQLARAYPNLGIRVFSVDVTRRGAAEVLGEIGESAVTLRGALAAGLGTAIEPSTVEALHRTLVGLGEPVLPSLLELTRDPNATARWRAVSAILGIVKATPPQGESASELHRAMAPLLEETSPEIALVATGVIAHTPEESGVALPLLLRNLRNHPGPMVRQASAEVIGTMAMEPERCVSALSDALEDSEEGTRVAAAAALGRFGEDAAGSVTRLASAASARSSGVRLASAAVRSLGRIGPRAREAIPVLLENLDEGEPAIRSVSAAALGRIASAPERVVPRLARALSDEDAYVRYNAGRALGFFGPAAAAAVPSLIEALWDPAESVRVRAAETLGEIGAAAKPARAALRAARNNNQSVMTRPVLAALERIEGEDER